MPTERNITRQKVRRAARAYRRAGLSFMPISADGTKNPAFELLPRLPRNPGDEPRPTWRVFKDRRPSKFEIGIWFRDWYPEREYGLAIIGGQVSGGLEIIDIDTADLAEPWGDLVEKKCPGLVQRLVRVRTPRPGMHAYYRCAAAGGNCKLARRPHRKPGDDNDRPKAVIEVKGEGGYCLAPPSPAACHPTGRRYELLDGMDFTMIPTISAEERQVLFDAARQFDTWREQVSASRRCRQGHEKQPPCLTSRPGDDLNARGDWAEILEPHGWRCVGDGGDQIDYWCRPGKISGVSASTNYEGSGLLYVFSSNADPFEPDRAYTKFHAYASLQHNGDFTAAAADLRRKGYGAAGPTLWRPKSNDDYSDLQLYTRRMQDH